MSVDIDALKQANPLPDCIERLTGQRIVRHKISCPLHEDRTPSLHIYDDGRFHCFACGVRGDVLDFVGYFLHGRSYNPAEHFRDVVDHLGGLDIAPLPAATPPERRPESPRLTIDPAVIERWHETMPAERRAWWHGRGLDDSVIDFYRLGWDGARYTIPLSYRGVYFGVKRRRSDVDDGIDAKYMMTKGSRAGLFGADCLMVAHHVIVCEGEIDCMLIRQAGLDSVSTTAGAGAWKQSWSGMFRHIPRVTLLYDNDAPGMDGALRVRSTMRKAQIVTLPEGIKDVGELYDAWGRQAAESWLRELVR